MTNPFLSIAVVLWGLMALLLLQQWIKPLKTVTIGVAFFIFLLIVITAPCLVVSEIVMGFLDFVFPEGWQEDGNQNPKF